MNKLFYDIEVFNDYFLFGYIDEQDNIIQIDSKSHSFIEIKETIKNCIDNNILIGYNNVGYDDVLIYEIVTNLNKWNYLKELKKYSDIIIFNKNHQIYKNIQYNYLKILSFDIMKAIGNFTSLKELESRFGIDIEETPVDFNKKELSNEDIELIKYYHKNDLIATKKVFENAQAKGGIPLPAYLESRLFLKEEYGININNGYASIVNKLFSKNNPRWQKPINWFKGKIPQEHLIDGKQTIAIKKYLIEVGGKGGLHYAPDKQKAFNDIHSFDVASQYPNVMILLNMFTEIIQDLINKRMELKKAGNDNQLAYKIIINAIYGNLGSEYSNIYDLNKLESVTMTSRQSLIELTRYLIDNISDFELVNLNTDGIFFTGTMKDPQVIIDYFRQFCNLELEYEHFDKIYQKDVNNYIAIKNGKVVKGKGAFVLNYFENYNNNRCSIIDKMVVNKLAFNIDFSQTLKDNTNIKDYCITYACRNSKDVRWDYVRLNQNDKKVVGKVNRVIATVDGEGNTLEKVNLEKNRVISFNDLPKTFTFVNQSVQDLCINDYSIDYDYYIQIAQNHYNAFK